MSLDAVAKHAFAYEGGDVVLADEHTVVTRCGNLLKFSSVVSNSQHFLPRAKASRIVAFDVNPKTASIALAACEENASIDIYTLPDKRWKGRLPNDTAAFEYHLLKFSRCGSRLLSLGTDQGNQLRVWDLDHFDAIEGCLATLPHRYSFASFNPLNPDQFVLGGDHGIVFWRVCKVQKTFCLSRLDAARTSERLVTATGEYAGSALSSDEAAEKRREYSCHCWSKDGKLYAANRMGELVKFDPTRGEIVAVVVLSRTVVLTSLVLTAECLVAGFSDGSVRWLHDQDFSVLQTVALPAGERLVALGLSPSHARIVLGSSGGGLYELKALIDIDEDEKSSAANAASLLNKLGGYHTGAVLSMSLLIPAGGTTNDAVVVSGGISGALYFWTVQSCKGISVLSLTDLFESASKAVITALAARYLDPIVVVGDSTGHVRILSVAKVATASIDVSPIHCARVCTTAIDLIEIHPASALALVASSSSHVVYVMSLDPERQFRILGFAQGPSPSAHLSMVKWVPTSSLETSAFVASVGHEMFYCALINLDERIAIEFHLGLLGAFAAATVAQRGVFLSASHALKLLTYVNFSAKHMSVLRINDAPKTIKCVEASSLHADAHAKPLTAIAKSPLASRDGAEIFATGAADGTLSIWLLQPTTVGATLKDTVWHIAKQKSIVLHAGAITAIVFSHAEDATYVYSSGVDGAIFCIELKPEHGLSLVKAVSEGASPLYVNLGRRSNEPEKKAPRWHLNDDGRPFLEVYADEQDSLARAKFDAIKDKIRGPLSDLQLKLKTMLAHNAELPEIEALARDEFVINRDLEASLLAQNAARAADVRSHIGRQIAEMNIVRERMKAEFWDTGDTKGVVLKGLTNTDLIVYNLPTRKLAANEKRREAAVQRLRQLEYQLARLEPSESVRSARRRTSAGYHHADLIPPGISWMVNAGLLHPTLGKREAPPPKPDEFDLAAPVRLVDLIYHPAMIRTRKQQRTQIALLLAYERQLLGEYNKDFDELARLKEAKMDEIEAKNTRIREIGAELQVLESPTVYTWSADEVADSVLTLRPDEMTKTPYETDEKRNAREAAEAAARALEARNQKDDVAGRALRDMMNGTLEVKKELVQGSSLVREPWMDETPTDELTPEQKLKLAAYDAEAARIADEKEKYKKSLDLELKKLKADIADICRGFDDKLKLLQELYLATRLSVLTQQMYVLRLGDVLMSHEHICHDLLSLSSEMAGVETEIASLNGDHAQFESRLESCKDEWHKAIEDDKALEKAFSREIEEAAGVPLEHDVLRSLTELYRKRRSVDDATGDSSKKLAAIGALRRKNSLKVAKQGSSRVLVQDGDANGGVADALLSNDESNDPFAFLDLKSRKKHEVRKVLPLDADADRPEAIAHDSPVWAALNDCRARKIHAEHIVKGKADAFAEAKEVFEASQFKLTQLGAKLTRCKNERLELDASIRLSSENLPILVKIKQGQDEASGDDVKTLCEESESALLICRAAVERLNETILLHGKDQVGILSKIKNFRKNINLMEWDHAYLGMQKKNMDDHYTDLQLLRVTKNLQEIFTTGDSSEKLKREQHLLEAKLAYMGKSHEANAVKQHKVLQSLHATLADRLRENDQFQRQLNELQTHIQIREDIRASRRSAKAAPAKPSSKMKAITVRRKLVDLAKAQTDEIEFMRMELDKMRRRTFPSFVQPLNQAPPDDFFAD
ncbi:hypothetical protein SDRG_01258 [Saprolegnia diclina VS20]|uniref:Cilia- and flagella-associated protein 43 n=1 Tax=Saprolegnia diclina (strain VS20) TaxID=1156394 RepID=T0S7X2_SAPDV|nr:hypothetical protein SDRG_01258 [Saprolegnia diclina VS20]EQC41283.1 hypothetical protein SDRG_01258 [Saprolegnia diclina VS20]|eukprot:XP_008604997.1 hypothetical protein SDRG_01258 [Saprolegnia diclina VS20]